MLNIKRCLTANDSKADWLEKILNLKIENMLIAVCVIQIVRLLHMFCTLYCVINVNRNELNILFPLSLYMILHNKKVKTCFSKFLQIYKCIFELSSKNTEGKQVFRTLLHNLIYTTE